MDCLYGRIFDGETFFEGYVCVEDGRIVETGQGRPPCTPCAEGIVTPGLVNCHTHAGDAGLRITAKMTIEELVAPPDGLKHRYLRDAPRDDVMSSMRRFTDTMFSFGVHRFADFREGGRDGCVMLSDIGPRPGALILGRPTSGEYDDDEMDTLLEVCDGIGIPSISDMPTEYAGRIADRVRRDGKVLAIHASERVREDIDSVLSLEPAFVVHMTASTDADMRRCADSGVPVVVCPRSNAYFGMTPPVCRMLDAGITVGAGTDNAMLCSPDIREEAAALRELMRRRPHWEDELTDIIMRNGRKILYDGTGIGLHAGMDADIAVFPHGKGMSGIADSAGTTVLNMTKGGE